MMVAGKLKTSLPPIQAPGILATEQKGKKKNSLVRQRQPQPCCLQLWELRTKETIHTPALGWSLGTFPFIETNVVVKSLGSNPRLEFVQALTIYVTLGKLLNFSVPH